MILEKLLESLNQYDEDSSNYIITQYILEHIDEISNQSIDEVAKKCYVSKSVVSKYVKKAGFQSYADFKEECHIQSVSRSGHIGRSDITYQTSNHFKEFSSHLNDNILFFSNNFQDFEKIIDDIKNHSVIYIYSQGDSRYLCHYLQYKLGFKGKSVVICDLENFLSIPFVEGSIAMVISSLGNSLSMSTRLMQKLEEHPTSWVISSKEKINHQINFLHIPVEDKQYSDIILKLALDYIISEL